MSIFLLSLIALGCKDDAKFLAFRNVNLVPMTGPKIIQNQTVLINGDRISDIGPSENIIIPQNTRVIDGEGAFLMPGLADMHVHLRNDWPLPQLDLYLANGVTTVRDLDGRDFMLQWREDINSGKRGGPTVYVAAPTIRGYEKNPLDLVLDRNAGFDCLKLYSYLSNEDYKKVMKLAKKHQLYTIGHVPFAVGLDGVIAAGMDEIAHVEELSFELIDFDRTIDLKPKEWLPYVIQKAIEQHPISAGFDINNLNNEQRRRLATVPKKLKSATIPVCTTLAVDDIIVQKLFNPDTFLARPESKYLPEKYKRDFRHGKEKHQIQFTGIKDLAPFKFGLDKTLILELNRAGIPLVLGTDAGTGSMGIVPGFSIHDELRILMEGGLTPYEAIAAGTVNASMVVEAMTGKNDFGTIEIGKRADFILVNKNPLEDVAHIKDKKGVMAGGEWYEAAYLQAAISPDLIPGIPVVGNVVHVRRGDNRIETVIEIVIGEEFQGMLPNDIDSISVTITDSKCITIPLKLPDYTYYKQFRDFWFPIPGMPKKGKYTFTVTSKGSSGSAVDYQSVIRTLPRPDSKTFSPADGQTLTSKTPTFSWASVDYADIEIYYRLVIDDLTGKRVYSSARVQKMLTHTLPEGVLEAGQTYRWRVRTLDNADWVEIQNRSDSNWLTVTMAENLD